MFKNDQEKQEAITHLPTLKDHPGWKFIERALDADVAQLEAQLFERKDFTSLEEVYKIQDLTDATKAFKNLPDKIVAEAKDKPPEQEDNDPY
jgi:hypothetical protein